jgi:hypothetical protein
MITKERIKHAQDAAGNLTPGVSLSDEPLEYRAAVDPEISGTPTPEIEIDGAGSAGYTGAPHLIRITVNPGDDVTAATRLQAGYPEVAWCLPEETISIRSSVAITDVYLVGVDYDTTAGTYTGTAYIISRDDATLADWQAQMAHFTFDADDDVREVVITMTALFNTSYARVKVQGISHAQS